MQGYDDYVNYAFKRNSHLLAGDFNTEVSVEHLDGSVFTYRSACIEIIERYLIVYSEHHHPDVFFAEDLKCWKGNPVSYKPEHHTDEEILKSIDTYASENIFEILEDPEENYFENKTTEELYKKAYDAYYTLKSHLKDIVEANKTES